MLITSTAAEWVVEGPGAYYAAEWVYVEKPRCGTIAPTTVVARTKLVALGAARSKLVKTIN